MTRSSKNGRRAGVDIADANAYGRQWREFRIALGEYLASVHASFATGECTVVQIDGGPEASFEVSIGRDPKGVAYVGAVRDHDGLVVSSCELPDQAAREIQESLVEGMVLPHPALVEVPFGDNGRNEPTAAERAEELAASVMTFDEFIALEGKHLDEMRQVVGETFDELEIHFHVEDNGDVVVPMHHPHPDVRISFHEIRGIEFTCSLARIGTPEPVLGVWRMVNELQSRFPALKFRVVNQELLVSLSVGAAPLERTHVERAVNVFLTEGTVQLVGVKDEVLHLENEDQRSRLSAVEVALEKTQIQLRQVKNDIDGLYGDRGQ